MQQDTGKNKPSPAPALVLLAGPTAVGKTELSLQLAEALGAEIVSADSLLFYRGMDIGTAKPSPQELARVRHHLIDIQSPNQGMSVPEYVHLAQAAVADIHSRGKRVLVVGGSGFYLKAFYAPVAQPLETVPEVRAEVDRLEAQGTRALLKRLRPLNPDGLGALDTSNPRRLARALERCLLTGMTFQQQAAAFARQQSPFAPLRTQKLLLLRGRDNLNQRIDARVSEMLRKGLVEELRRLKATGIEQNPSAAGSIGYREVLAADQQGALEKACGRSELAQAIALHTRQLAARQRKWFRNQYSADHICNLDNLTDHEALEQLVQASEARGC
jgi:tRNA dimethylallyltransferase